MAQVIDLPAADSLEYMEEYVYSVMLPEPANEGEWRKIVKDPSKFIAKKVAKGVEVSWQKLSPEQRRAMTAAQAVEIKEWVASKVCEGAVGKVPESRLMRMRWVLTFKETETKGQVKAKARLVVLGFTDPDVGLVNVRSPTLTRRGRQLLLAMSVHKGWSFLKADAKTAFLQGTATQRQRGIFGIPVPELREALGLEQGQAVQFLKAAYGLTIAPREFYLFVHEILIDLGMERLLTEPCLWRLRVLDPKTQELRTVGLVGAHVDDFLMVGNESHTAWEGFLNSFHDRMRWSPWEVPPMNHCGVHMRLTEDGGWRLDQEEFCEGINQVAENGKSKDLTEEERRQCRAVLGSAQWRVYQTAPHHAAKLSHLQSSLPRGDRETLREINRFTRELYSQKDVHLQTFDLGAENDDDIVAVGWSDAALANRVDLGSTGGMIVGLVHRSMVDDGVKGKVNLISWSSSRLKRVCRSSLAAETQALSETEQELMFVRIMWREMLGDVLDLRDPSSAARKMRGVLVIDAKALYDSIQQGDLPSFQSKEKYTALEVLSLTQNLDQQGTVLRWCNSDMQLADGMTKIGAQDRMRRFLQQGQEWNVVYDPTFTAAKKLRSRATPEPAEADLRDTSWLDILASRDHGAFGKDRHGMS